MRHGVGQADGAPRVVARIGWQPSARWLASSCAWRTVLVAALAGQLLVWSGHAAYAAEEPCLPIVDPPALEAAPDDPRAADLPAPFSAGAWGVDRERLLTEAQERVARELASIDAPACFAQRLPHIAARTALLSPLEFLIVSLQDDRDARAALLETYRRDPRTAYQQMLAVWPSPRAELALQNLAFYDIDADQVFVNTRAVPADLALNVVVHEFWHALANVRYEDGPDGSQRRITGFWMEVLPAGSRVWHQVDEKVNGDVPTYLMNEAVAVEMEVTATGKEPPDQRPDLADARQALHELFRVGGRARVLILYLESRQDELKELARRATGLAGA